MATREENLKKINEQLENLTDEQLEQVAGGTFTPNYLPRVTYTNAGIRVIDHFFAKDEFFYRDKPVTHEEATAIAIFYRENKTHPSSIEFAVKWEKEFDEKFRKNMRRHRRGK